MESGRSTTTSFEGNELEPPFDKDIHLLTPTPTVEQQQTFDVMKQRLASKPLYEKYQNWATDRQITRFLVARNYNLDPSLKLITEALEWREKRRPHEIIENMEDWDEKLAKESETGKIYCPGKDRWGRPVVVFNNDVQNTRDAEDHMNFLAWNLEFASQLMDETVADKYVIFCHLTQFSLFSAPSFSETLETIQMLTGCFPERLGHFVCYQAPAYFRTVFAMVRGYLDQKTVNKMVFLSGDTSDGSENDHLMRQLLGRDWKLLSGVEQPIVAPKCSPGYDHKTFWPTVRDRIEEIKSTRSGKFLPPEPPSTAEEERTAAESEVVESLDGLVM